MKVLDKIIMKEKNLTVEEMIRGHLRTCNTEYRPDWDQRNQIEFSWYFILHFAYPS